ncbi:MAG: hypothetical protein AAF696_24330 [Bacteroidota bacterium]
MSAQINKDNSDRLSSEDIPIDKTQEKLSPDIQEASGIYISKRLFRMSLGILLLLCLAILLGFRNQRQRINQLQNNLGEMQEKLNTMARQQAQVDSLILLTNAEDKLAPISSALDAEISLKKNKPQLKSSSVYSSLPSSKISETQRPNISPPPRPKNQNLPPKNVAQEPTQKKEKISAKKKQPKKERRIQRKKQTSSHSRSTEPTWDAILNGMGVYSRSTTSQKENIFLPEEGVGVVRGMLADEKTTTFKSGLEAQIAMAAHPYSQAEITYGGGLGLEFQIGENLAIRSGARLSQLSYELTDLSPESLGENFGARFPGIIEAEESSSLREVEMKGAYFQIPLGLRYYHTVHRYLKVFSGIDIAAGRFLNQKFDYELQIEDARQDLSTRAVDIPWDMVSSRFSLGAMFSMDDSWDCELAVFFEKDLSNRGVEDFSYYLLGISTAVWLKR